MIAIALFLFGILCSSGACHASDYIVVQDIVIEGNQRTKDKIILRELDIQPGDTIFNQFIPIRFQTNQNRIFNTGLFIKNEIYLRGKDAVQKTLVVSVEERFFTYPIPIFEIADRNFNEWWQQRGRDFRRTNIGIDFKQKNVRGRNETLKAKLQIGFDKKAEIFYHIPYLDQKQRIGLTINTSFITNKQIAYRTINHRLAFFESPDYIKNRFNSGLTFSYRRNFYEHHHLGLNFYRSSIGDTVAILNPEYFLEGRTMQRMFTLRYSWAYDKRDITYYPLKGYIAHFEAEKLGLGIFDDINQTNLRFELSEFIPLPNKWYFAVTGRTKLSFPQTQPYFNVRGLGYHTDLVSGYELYVVDGQHYFLGKINMKKKIFSIEKNMEDVPGAVVKSFPLALFVKFHSDAGYVTAYNPQPENMMLSNRFLWGNGIGLDMVSFYDLVFRLEYSINRLGEHGFFFHFNASI
jgi:outer membrane protein assembly factor BamA